MKKALESFVEKEDEFIKQVIQQQPVFNEALFNGFSSSSQHKVSALLTCVTAGGKHHPSPGEASSRGPGVSIRGLFSKDAVAVSLTVALYVILSDVR